MSFNPLNDLKRRLDDASTPLSKRLCLAKNIVYSHHFPTVPKEKVIAEWLDTLIQRNRLGSEQLRNILQWPDSVDDLTSDLKSKLIQLISVYVKQNPLEDNDINSILIFLEQDTIAIQLSRHIEDYLTITITLLQCLKITEVSSITNCKKIFNNIIKYYKESKKKLEFLTCILNGENIETILDFLETECHDDVVNLCKNILFPTNRKSFFASFLQTLIRKENIDDLVNEKGDNIKSVLKVMSTFFTFPNSRTNKDPKFIIGFIDVFVNCFRNESQLIFAFYILATSCLNMDQSYLNPAMVMPIIKFEQNNEKIKRNIFLNMLKILHQNEVDLSIRLTDTFGEKISKVEIKKNFATFLQAVMIGQLKLQGKLDKITLQIITTAIKLDPILIEQNMNQILPPIMTAKKYNSSVTESYVEMMNCLLEILFKLSRGITFIPQMLPNIKLSLETYNTEQIDLAKQLAENEIDDEEREKIKNKIITGDDIFPKACIDTFGKLTSDLMFRQNSELLTTLQKDLEVYCLMTLEEGFFDPSVVILTETLTAIFSTFFNYNKMADHTVPLNIAEDFWKTFQKLEKECLKKLAKCLMKLDYQEPLVSSFLKLCLSISHLKILNVKYSNCKLDITPNSTEVYDLSFLLPYLKDEKWMELAGRVTGGAAVMLDNLLVAKSIALQILQQNNLQDINSFNAVSTTKSHLIKELSESSTLLENNEFVQELLSNLDVVHAKQVAKTIIKTLQENPQIENVINSAISNNKTLLHALVKETCKNIMKLVQNTDVHKAMSKADFDIVSYVKNVQVKEVFDKCVLKENVDDEITNYIETLKYFQICYLEGNIQLTAIFVLLIVKNCYQAKKIKRNIDYILQNIFELSPRNPDLYKIFPLEFIFSFVDKTLLNLLVLKIKSSNQFLIIKTILESAVKKIKTDGEIVKTLVNILLSEHKKSDMTNIESFSDIVFQISCTILPIIAKEKRAITQSVYRSVLANLQEKLHKYMLKSFKNIDFKSSMISDETLSNPEDSMIVSENETAALNSMDAFSLTLSKYCETTDAEEIKNLDYLWSGLQFFMDHAIKSIENQSSKRQQYVDSSLQLINIVLRHFRKLESHEIFSEKDKLFIKIWQSITSRLQLIFGQKVQKSKKKQISNVCLQEITVAVKFLCELASVECFNNNFVTDLEKLCELEEPSKITKKEDISAKILTSHTISKYLWSQCLRANIVGQKCIAMSKTMHRICKNIRLWIWRHFENKDGGKVLTQNTLEEENTLIVVKVEDRICEILKVDLQTISEVVLAAKKISLDYKFLDTIFELQHLIQYIIGHNTKDVRCDISWHSFFSLYEGSLAILNSLLLSRGELLEDRWPCYLQCYRVLVSCLCARATSEDKLDKAVEDRLSEIAHSIEKLTQSISKRKTHVSRLASYIIADICASLEKTAPSRMVRQHLENSVAMLIQTSDASHSIAFLKRALAGSPGQLTMSSLYTVYKRYHKYTGNS